MLYISFRYFGGRLGWLPPGLGSGKLLPGLKMLYALFRVVLCSLSGVGFPACAGSGIPLMFPFSVSPGDPLVWGCSVN